jgi:protein involved in polysaccharide export with SLBB domain
MIRVFARGAIVAVGWLLTGCNTDFGRVVDERDPPTGTVSVVQTTTQIQPGDRIKLTVYGEDTLSGAYEISPLGTLSLPLVGTIDAAGLTRAELERAIARRTAKFIKDPKVTVAVNQFRPFYIMGEVLRPGEYSYRSGLNALTAISTAGGLTYRGSKSTVLLQHAGEDVWHEYPLTAAVEVSPGDLIRVPERYF